MKKFITHIILTIFFTNLLMAQISINEDSTMLEIPPLPEIIDAAHMYSPLLKAKSKSIEAIGEEIIIEKKRWMEHIYLEGTTNYGLYDNLVVSGEAGNETSSGTFLSRNEQVRYYGGIRVKLPISSVLSRKNSVKAKHLSQKQAEYELMQLRENIKLLIIDEYFQLRYLEECMNNCSKIYQTLEISYLKAENDLMNGNMQFDDFAILASTTGKSKNDYLKAKNGFYAQFNKLQSLSGLKFNLKK